jgi:uncharacterized protein YdhG (YjbR/CyaY superfamily)
MKAAPSIEAYIASAEPKARPILKRLRRILRKAAPDATEVISYGMPAFRENGVLLYFAAFKNHIGVYPPISGDKALEKALARYRGPKGNLQFPLSEPIPYDLIERIAGLRVKQDAAKAAAKRPKNSR